MFMTARKIFLPQKEALINMPGAQKPELCTALFPSNILWNSSTNNFLCEVDDDDCFFPATSLAIIHQFINCCFQKKWTMETYF